jgi:arylsulfatase A-like enzyme
MNPPKAIIMVTLDCVRPDHLGCYGYLGVNTPHMDQIAHQGVVFEQAICQAPNTWVSHGAIFTACNPYKNGVRTHSTILSDQVVTVAEAFSQAGFATAAFPAHTLVGPARGFNRGFDLFDLDESEFLHASANADNKFYRDWGTMWARAKTWMSEQTTPFFIWLHYMGTHWEPHEALSLPVAYQQKYSAYGQFFDGKISWSDKECIGEIEDFLNESGLIDDSVVAIFSDHGDDLPANDPPYVWGGHNQNLFDNVMKIALIMRAPGRLPVATRVKAQVRSIDIAPTLLDLAGVPIPESAEGISLIPYCKTEPVDDVFTKYAFMENLPRHWLGIRTLEWKLILTDKLLPVPEAGPSSPQNTIGVFKIVGKSAVDTLSQYQEQVNPAIYACLHFVGRAARWTYRLFKRPAASKPTIQPSIREQPEQFESRVLEQGRVFALYNLIHDPAEQHDVSAQHPDIVTWLKTELKNMVTQSATTKLRDMNERDREEIERRLEALGYL